AESQVLVNGLDPEGPRVARGTDVHELAVPPHLALVRRVDPGDALDQNGLTGAVIAGQGGHLPGRDVEVDVGEGPNRTKVLADATEAQERFRLADGLRAGGSVPDIGRGGARGVLPVRLQGQRPGRGDAARPQPDLR